MSDAIRVLFVCTANICRSAYAEVMARHPLGDDPSVEVSPPPSTWTASSNRSSPDWRQAGSPGAGEAPENTDPLSDSCVS